MPRIIVLHTVEHLRAFEGGLVAQGYVRIFVGDFEERFADVPPVGFSEPGQFLNDFCCAHGTNLVAGGKIVIRQIHLSIPSSPSTQCHDFA
jgi:hypothetical protein